MRVFKIGVFLGITDDDARVRPEVRSFARRQALTDADRAAVRALQRDIPIVESPFSSLAAEAGEYEEELLRRAISLRESGVMRRFSAVLTAELAVTIEDLVEEIVGEIRDEHEKAEIVKESESAYIFNGNTDVDLLEKLLGVRPDEKEATTIAGLVSELAGHIP